MSARGIQPCISLNSSCMTVMCRKNIDEEEWDMPAIEMKTNTAVTVEQKEKIAAGFTKAFEAVGEAEVSQNMLVEIDGERWIDFRGDAG